MKLKAGAIMTGLQLQMRDVLIAADQIWKDAGYEFVVTEGTGGEHSAGSLHYYGYAVDLRASAAWRYKEEDISQMVGKLKLALGSDYNVVIHKSHVHVEFDRAKWL